MEQLKVRQRAEAIKRMKLLRLPKEIIEAFRVNGSVHLCARPSGNFLALTEAEAKEVKASEQSHGAHMSGVTTMRDTHTLMCSIATIPIAPNLEIFSIPIPKATVLSAPI